MRILYCLIFALTTHLVQGQHKVRNVSLKDPSLKLLYSLCENKLVFSDIQNDTTFHLKSAYSRVTKLDDSTFQLTPKSFVTYDTVYLYKNTSLIQSYLFVVHGRARPKVQLGEINSETASIEQIKGNTELILISVDDYISSSKILGFELVLKNINGEVKHRFESIEGNKLNSEVLATIETLVVGDIIQFTNIRVVDSIGIGRRFGPLEIQLVKN